MESYDDKPFATPASTLYELCFKVAAYRSSQYSTPSSIKHPSPRTYPSKFTACDDSDPLSSDTSAMADIRPQLVISFTNYGFLDIALNFWAFMQRAGVHNVILFSLDEKSYAALSIRGITTYWLRPRDAIYTESSSNFGTVEFNSICNVKPWIVLECLKAGFDVVWTDTDVIWLNDAQKYFDRFPNELDILIQSDDDDVCAGFFHVRSRPRTIALFERVVRYTNIYVDDQSALRRFIKLSDHVRRYSTIANPWRTTEKFYFEEGIRSLDQTKSPSINLKHHPLIYLVPFSPFDMMLYGCEDSHILNGWDTMVVKWPPVEENKANPHQPCDNDSISICVLNRLLFPNGTCYFNAKLPQRLGIRPIIIHNNCYIGHDSKTARFKMYDLWEPVELNHLQSSKVPFDEPERRDQKNQISQRMIRFNQDLLSSTTITMPKHVIHLVVHREIVTALSVHPDQTKLYTASYDKTLRCYSIERDSNVPYGYVSPRERKIHQVDNHDDPEYTVSAWKPTNEQVLNKRGGIWTMAWCRKRQSLSSKIQSPIDMNCLEDLSSLELQHHDPSQFDNDWVCITAGHDKKVLVWETLSIVKEMEIQDRWKCHQVLTGHLEKINQVTILNPDLPPAGPNIHSASSYFMNGKLCSTGNSPMLNPIIFSASDDGMIKSWDLDTGKLLGTYLGSADWITALALTSDGLALFGAGRDGVIRAWDIRSRRIVQVYKGHANWIRALHIVPDRQQLISGCSSGMLKIWDDVSGECLLTVQAHSSGINVILVNQNNHDQLYTAGDDGTIRVWLFKDQQEANLRPNLQCVGELRGHHGVVSCLAQTDQWIFSGGFDRHVLVWSKAEIQALFEG